MVVGRPRGWRLITGATPASAPIANAAEPTIGVMRTGWPFEYALMTFWDTRSVVGVSSQTSAPL